MMSPRVAFAVSLIVSTAAVSWSADSKKVKKGPHKNEARMVVRLTVAGTDKGLQLIYPKTISAAAAKPVKFPITIVNLLKEEVFLEVTDHDDLSYHLKQDRNIAFGGGGGFGGDNESLLKRLHACTYKDGKPQMFWGVMASIPGKIDFGENLPLSQWIGAKATIEVFPRGFYRANGKEFSMRVEMPVEIIK